MKYININGKITAAESAAIPIDNGAFRYGYGLFETMLVKDGVIRLGKYHWDRLFAGLKQLCFEISPFLTHGKMEEEVLNTARKNQSEKLCRVRLQFFAGGGGIFGKGHLHSGFVIECFPLEPASLLLNENGLVAGVADGLNKSTDALSNLKSCNALIYAAAAKQAQQNKWNDALICNTAGNIIESTIANIFWIKDDIVYTPPLADGCVAGVMRRHVVATVPVVEKNLTMDLLAGADEVFLSNAIKGIKWVGETGGQTFSNKKTRAIAGAL